jgi:penicillin-binding protein 1A
MDNIKQLIQNLWITSKKAPARILHWLWVQFDILLVKLLGEEKVSTFYKKLDVIKATYWDAKQKVVDAVEERVDKESFYYRKIKQLWKFFGWTVSAGAFYLFCIHTNFLWLTGEMPSVSELQNPKLSQSSEIYSSDGVLMGKYFLENRTPVKRPFSVSDQSLSGYRRCSFLSTFRD